jgi:hypothetical protein
MGYVDSDEQGGTTPTAAALFNTLKELVTESSINANNNDVQGANYDSNTYFTTSNFTISGVTADHFTISGVAPNYTGSKTIYYTLRKNIAKAGANFSTNTVVDLGFMDDTQANNANTRRQYIIDKFNVANAISPALIPSTGFENFPVNTAGITGSNIVDGNRNHYITSVAGDFAFNISAGDIELETTS